MATMSDTLELFLINKRVATGEHSSFFSRNVANESQADLILAVSRVSSVLKSAESERRKAY